MNNADKSVLADLETAITSIHGAIGDLMSEADAFYGLGDNHRGNIRHDATIGLGSVLQDLTTRRDTLANLLKV